MNNCRYGFTLMELLAVVAIVAVLAVTASWYFSDSIAESRHAVVRQNVKITREAISRYFKERMEYPTSLASLSGPYLAQNPFDMLIVPMDGASCAVEVEVPADGTVNAFQASEFEWELYDFSSGGTRQFRNLRFRLDNSIMNW